MKSYLQRPQIQKCKKVGKRELSEQKIRGLIDFSKLNIVPFFTEIVLNLS